MASCTSTAHTRITQRFAPRPGVSGPVVIPVSVLLTALPLPWSGGASLRRRGSGASARRGEGVVDDALPPTRLETLALRLDGVLGVDRGDHARLEDPEPRARGPGHEGHAAERGSDPRASDG